MTRQGTNSDTPRRKCAIVFGPTSATYNPPPNATYPVTRDTYGQPWLTVWSGTSDWSARFFHLTGSAAHQVVTFHLFNLCLSTLAGGVSMCLPPGWGGVRPQSLPESDQLDCVSTVVMSNHCKVTMFVSIQYMLYEPVPFEHFLGQKHLTPSESGMSCVALVRAGIVQGKITPMCGM